LKRKLSYLALAVFFIIAFIGLSPYRLMIGQYQISFSWLLSIPILGFLLYFIFSKISSSGSEVSKKISFPLLIGGGVVIIHFGLSYFLLEPGTFICSNSSMSVLSPFFITPGWVISKLPIISSIIYVLTLIKINDYYLVILISSCYYGYASSLVVTRRKHYPLIGIILLTITLLFECFIIYGAIATGCDA
jgi:hypothetical protein